MRDKRLFNKYAHVDPILTEDTRFVLLSEIEHPEITYKIHDLPENAYCIRLDLYDNKIQMPDRLASKLSDLLPLNDKNWIKEFQKSVKHLHKRCDFVLVDNHNSIVILIELKEEESDNKASEQLVVTEEFIKYAISVTNLISESTHQYEFRYVKLFSRFDPPKMPVTTDRTIDFIVTKNTPFQKEINLIKPLIIRNFDNHIEINYQKLIQTQ